MKNLQQCISKKELVIKKSAKVQGAIKVHFPSNEVTDIVLQDDRPVDVFGRIGITADLIKKSNLQALYTQGLIVIV